MEYTKKDLLEVLQHYKDDDIIVGTIWTKEDVEYQLAEIQSDLTYLEGITQEDVDSFPIEDFWNDYAGELGRFMENDTSAYNEELYSAIIDRLQSKVVA